MGQLICEILFEDMNKLHCTNSWDFIYGCDGQATFTYSRDFI